MGNNHARTSRRDFLKVFGSSTGLALYQSPIQILIEAIVTGAVQSANAAEVGLPPARRLVHLVHQGAPPRWTWDQFLTPYSADGFVANEQLGTAYNFLSTGAKLDYRTVLRSGINVPPVWAMNVPSPGGGSRPMSALLNNMLHMRGIQVGNPDHGAATALQFQPAGASQSVPALSADVNEFPISAVNTPITGYKFLSAKAKSNIALSNGGNLLTQLLSPFTATPAGTFITKRNKMGPALDATLDILNKASEGQRKNIESMTNAHTAAKELMSQGFGNLTTSWNTLLGKYSSIASQCFDPTRAIPGITDDAIINDGSKRFQLNGVAITNPDLRQLIGGQERVNYLAEHFAMTEFLLLNNLSSSVAIGPGPLVNFLAVGTPGQLATDEHLTGGATSLILNTYMNFAIAACLVELIEQLKLKNLYDETVLVIGGEFSRSARTDGIGSDHGFMGSSSAVYSGAIKGPIVIGNIYKSKQQDSSDSGTWGNGAPVAELGRALNLNDWASTIAYLLRVPSPSTAASTLIIKNSAGEYQSVIEKAKQV